MKSYKKLNQIVILGILTQFSLGAFGEASSPSCLINMDYQLRNAPLTVLEFVRAQHPLSPLVDSQVKNIDSENWTLSNSGYPADADAFKKLGFIVCADPECGKKVGASTQGGAAAEKNFFENLASFKAGYGVAEVGTNKNGVSQMLLVLGMEQAGLKFSTSDEQAVDKHPVKLSLHKTNPDKNVVYIDLEFSCAR